MGSKPLAYFNIKFENTSLYLFLNYPNTTTDYVDMFCSILSWEKTYLRFEGENTYSEFLLKTILIFLAQ